MRSLLPFLWNLLLDVLRIAASRRRLLLLFRVPLYSNAFYLMLNSGANAVLGFGFWVIAARLYSAEDVGLGSALVSAATLLSFVASMGLGYGLIRFLPTAGDRTQTLINSALTLSALVSAAVALVYVAGLDWWSPALRLVRDSPLYSLVFIVLVVAGTTNIIMRQTFVAFRRAGLALATGLIAALGKIALVVVMAATFKVFGVVVSWGVAVVAAIGVGLLLLLPRAVAGYRPRPSFSGRMTGRMARFSLASYFGDGLWSVPGWILPLVVVHILGAEANAYFYISWAMAGLLSGIPMAVSLSLLAEGSHEQTSLAQHLTRSLKFTAVLLVPAMAVFFLAGDRLLLAFGEEYSAEGVQLLWILAASAVPASVNYLYLGVARVQGRLKSIIVMSSGTAVGTIGLSYILLPVMGITGVGIAWLASQTAVAAALVPRLRKVVKEPNKGDPDVAVAGKT